MKKLVLSILIIFGFAISSKAQIQYYKTTACAFANIYNGKYHWGEWQSSDMVLTINLNNDVITIYSPKIQIYKVYKVGQIENGKTVGSQLTFYVYDQDFDKGTIRLRVAPDRTSQIYIDFSNIAWVYNVIRTN